MLIELLHNGVINKETFLLQNYKKIGLNENQVIIILSVLKRCENNDKTYITPELFAPYMTIPLDAISDEIDDLVEKGLVKVTSKNLIFDGVYEAIAIKLEIEREQQEGEEFIAKLNANLQENISYEDLAYLKTLLATGYSREKILKTSKEGQVKTFKDLKNKILNKNAKKPSIIMYDWLND
ncbi:DnaD family protein [Mesoplasma lactucae]|uniref:DnaD family protein n=1 Tax=Mesoplasma lactucae TaxID=138853 RepID=UPI000CA143F5|nr:DnaD family protein [Mesoplasma lactucae]ATZ20258.1 hypothetical protein MLACT_v1c04370 [Mesoplasma lactucae ATCC 49193]MCL8216429.1 hypothetical protein [Mesoplasma lactucae ATCC 49193]